MERVVLDGVTYVPSAEAAAQFGYTSDYIGQLCRGKKIDARLVGRSWYVNLDSVKEYRQHKHTKRQIRAAEKKRTKAKKTKVKINSPDRSVRLPVHENKQSVTGKSISIKYETDTSELLPTVIHPTSDSKAFKIAPKAKADFVELGTISGDSIPVTAEKSVTIKVESPVRKSKVTHLVADELPSVALKGQLSVADADAEPPQELMSDEQDGQVDSEVDSLNTNKKKTFLHKISSILLWPVDLIWKLLYPIRYVVRRVLGLVLLATRPAAVAWKKFKKPTSRKTVFTPQSIQTHVSEEIESPAPYFTTSTHWVLHVFSLVVSAVLIGVLILSIGGQLVVGDGASDTRFYIDQTWFSTLFVRQ